jgi:hypothetical protein
MSRSPLAQLAASGRTDGLLAFQAGKKGERDPDPPQTAARRDASEKIRRFRDAAQIAREDKSLIRAVRKVDVLWR